MAESHSGREVDQPRRLGTGRWETPDPQAVGGRPQQRWIAEWFRGRQEQEKHSIVRQRLNPPGESLFEAAA
jgi:hypothetical protein